MTGFKVSNIQDKDAAVNFILSKVLKFTEDKRGALYEIIDEPDYIYLTTIVVDEDLSILPFDVELVTLPNDYYVNIQDYKVEVPYIQTPFGIEYKTLESGDIFSVAQESIKKMLLIFVATDILKHYVNDPITPALLTEDGLDMQTEDGETIIY